MALICPVCNAENREGANFCRSCGGKLAPAAPPPKAPPPGAESRSEREWAATAPAQLRAPTIPGGLFDGSLPIASQPAYAHAGSLADEKTVIAGAGRAKRPPSPPREPRAKKASKPRTPRASRPAGAEASKPPRMRAILLWLVLLAVGLLMIVAGWQGYGKGTRSEQAEATSPAAPVGAPAVAPAPALPAPETPPSPPAEPPVAADAALAAAAPATPAATTPKSPSAVKPRKPVPAAPPQPGAPEVAPAVAAAPAPQSAPPPADPMSICGDRNFIAKAQCMAAQCLKPEFKPHAQCEAVRRQQRIEEEKRNPTLVN
jgi:hypothetical protein